MSNVRNFGAAGDGITDDTAAVRHAVAGGDGMLHFPPGTYRLTGTIDLPLGEKGPLGIEGTGGTARVLMTGAGPAFRLTGTHAGTGDPASVRGTVYPRQRLPTLQNLEIEGAHPEADGVELLGTLQPVFEGVLIRRCRHGIRLVKRNRNVIISHCHVYDNTGVGIYLDGVNLHQIIISGSHISYNRLGGIRIERSEVRNLQITGCDIEYNNHARHGTPPEPTAEIYVDTTAPGSSVAEVTIASNTIQATASPEGCNLLIRSGTPDHPSAHGLWTVTGNIIGSQETNVRLIGCYGVTLTGNVIYSAAHRNVRLEGCRQVVLSGNVFRRHTPAMNAGVRIERSADILVSGCAFRDEHPDGQPTNASLLEIAASHRVTVSGCQLIDGVPCGIDVSDSESVLITGCTVRDTREPPRARHAIRFSGKGATNRLGVNDLGGALDALLSGAPESGVSGL